MNYLIIIYFKILYSPGAGIVINVPNDRKSANQVDKLPGVSILTKNKKKELHILYRTQFNRWNTNNLETKPLDSYVYVHVCGLPRGTSGNEPICQGSRHKRWGFDPHQRVGLENPLGVGMTTHSSMLTWRIPWTEEPGGLQSMRIAELDMTATSMRAHTRTYTHTHTRLCVCYFEFYEG